jgi:non-heme chloroperoxidase
LQVSGGIIWIKEIGKMPYIKVGKENTGDIELFYEDYGSGRPVVLIHGWPLSHRSWEKQVPVLVDSGYRVVMYDRRGFGGSSKPMSGYNYDVFTEDLQNLITALDLHDAVLVGFSMGGGEVARYLGTHGSARVGKAVFISAIPPFLLKTPGNPSGIDGSVFDDIKQAIGEDRLAFLTQFFKNFYNYDDCGSNPISEEVLRFSWHVAAGASFEATFECVTSWLTDFRKDLALIDIPTLVIHGDADRICPIDATGNRINEAVKGSRLVVPADGSHGLIWTHWKEVNRALLDFLNEDGKK